MYSITSTLNSTFGTIGNATADKMTAKVVGKLELSLYVPVNSKTAHPPPGQTPGHLTFLKNFGQIPRYVASLDVKCPTR